MSLSLLRTLRVAAATARALATVTDTATALRVTGGLLMQAVGHPDWWIGESTLAAAESDLVDAILRADCRVEGELFDALFALTEGWDFSSRPSTMDEWFRWHLSSLFDRLPF